MAADLVARVSLGADQAVDLARKRADQEAAQALRRVVQEVGLVQAPKAAHHSLQVAA